MVWMATTQIAVLALFLLGSVVFLLIHGYNDWLYVRSEQGWPCISRNEWIWLVLSNSLLMISSFFATKQPHPTFVMTRNQARVLFLGLNLVWFILAVASSALREEAAARPVSWWISLLGGKAAWPALFDLAMILIPVHRWLPLLDSKRGVGLSVPRDTMVWHTWCGHAVVFWLLAHTCLLSWDYYTVQSNYNLHQWWTLMVPVYFPVYTEGDVNFAGWVSFVSLSVMWLASRPVVRQRCYEMFYCLHVLFGALFVVFAHMHDYNTFYFVAPALTSWFADLYLRRHARTSLQLVSDNAPQSSDEEEAPRSPRDGLFLDHTTSDKLTVVGNTESPTIRLCFPIPSSWSQLEPGMFVYLSTTTKSRIASRNPSCHHDLLHTSPHPFSISAFSDETFSLHIKALGDWTSSLVENELRPCLLQGDDRVATTRTSNLFHFNIEGPYGGSALTHTLETFGSRIFLAAGVGLAGVMPFANRKREDVILWWVGTVAEARVLQDLLVGIQHVKVYVTREGACSESNIGQHDRLPPLLSTCTVPVRYTTSASSSPCLQRICATSAIVGMTLSHLLARLICCNQPFIGQDNQRYHTCSFMNQSSECTVCDTDLNADRCCQSTSCYYCFRGAPILLFFVLTPLCTWLGPCIIETLTLRWKQFSQYQYRSPDGPPNMPEYVHRVGMESLQNDDSVASRDGGDTDPPAVPSHTESLNRDHLQDLAWHYGKVDIGTVLAEQLQSSNNSAVVTCGPELFVHSVKRQVQRQHPSVRVFPLNG